MIVGLNIYKELPYSRWQEASEFDRFQTTLACGHKSGWQFTDMLAWEINACGGGWCQVCKMIVPIVSILAIDKPISILEYWQKVNPFTWDLPYFKCQKAAQKEV